MSAQVLFFDKAFDSIDPGVIPKELSLKPVDRQGFVKFRDRWYLAKSNGEKWVLSFAPDGESEDKKEG